MCHEALTWASISQLTSFHLISPPHNGISTSHNKHTAMSSGIHLLPRNCHRTSSALERRRMGSAHSARILFYVSEPYIVLL